MLLPCQNFSLKNVLQLLRSSFFGGLGKEGEETHYFLDGLERKVCSSREKFQQAPRVPRQASNPARAGGRRQYSPELPLRLHPHPRALRVAKSSRKRGSSYGTHVLTCMGHVPQETLHLECLDAAPRLGSTSTPAWELQLHYFLAKTTNSRVVKQVSKISWHRLRCKLSFPFTPWGSRARADKCLEYLSWEAGTG